jgi:hypothetical protein
MVATAAVSPALVAASLRRDVNRQIAYAGQSYRVVRASCLPTTRTTFFCRGRMNTGQTAIWSIVRVNSNGTLSWNGARIS